MRRILGVGVAALLLAAGCSDDGGSTSDEEPATTTTAPVEAAGPTLGPLVSGTASIVDGTYVWTDYAYDDRGANANGPGREDLDTAGGDAVVGNGWTNEADLIQLQLGLDDDGQVTVRAVLETLTDPAVPRIWLSFDTDGDEATGGAVLLDPDREGGVTGFDTNVDLRAEGATVDAAVDEETFETTPIEVTVDAEANTLEATLPLTPEGETWRTVAAVFTVDGPLYDLAFVGDEPEYRWQDDIQADVLAGHEDPEVAVTEIDFGQLAEGGTELADGRSPGFHTYLYESELDLGEGVVEADEEDGNEYRGPYQPYLVWIPDDGPGEGEPLTLFLHGLTQNHLGSVISPDGGYLGTGRPLSEEIHNLGQYARDGMDFPPHNLTVWPLARGEGLGYRGIAEEDSLAVLADATERFRSDPDRIILSGGSMGGIGAFRLGSLYPDRFSVAAPLIGLATESTVPLLQNFWNLPIRQINGGMDPLIEPFLAEATTDELDRLEVPFRAWMLDQRGHEAGGYAYDCVFESLPEFERATDPPDVYYTVDPEQFVSDPASGLELSYDGAYWVSGMVLADDSALGSVEGHRVEGDGEAYEAVHVDRRGESGPDGGDLCGPNPDVTTDDTWRERAVDREPIPVPVLDPEVQLVLTNLSAVTVEVFDGAQQVTITSDTPAEVTLTGVEEGERTVEVDEGETTVELD